MQKYSTFIFIIVFVSLISCGESQKDSKEPISPPNEWEKIDRDEFSIQYPDSFRFEKRPNMNVEFIFFSKLNSSDDTFSENINLITENLSGKDIDLDKYVQISEKQISTLVTDGKLISSERLERNDKEFHKIIYTGKQGIYDLKWHLLLWVIDEKAYILTFTSEKDQYNNYVKIAEKIMKTFKLK